jgi:hypothetical protein
MTKFSTLARGVVAGALCMFAWGGSAHAVLLSDIYTAQMSGGTIAAPTITVGDILFTLQACGGNVCKNSPLNQGYEVVGVPADANTGAGGGIRLQSVAGAPLLDPANIPANSNDVSLTWSATSLLAMIGGQGSSVGSGLFFTPTTNISDSAHNLLATVNMNPGPALPDVKTFAGQTTVTGFTDLSVPSGTLYSGTVFLSQVPEPISMSLLLTGLVGLACARRSRRQTCG